MSGGPRRRTATFVLLAGMIAATASLWLLYLLNRNDLVSFWSLVATVASLAVAVAQFIRTSTAVTRPDRAAEALRAFADRLALDPRYSVRAVLGGRLIRQTWSDALPRSNRHHATHSGSFSPIGGFDPVTESSAATGDVLPGQAEHRGRTALHSVFAGLLSGRMAVAGPRGSGKTSAATVIADELLTCCRTNGVDKRSGAPVPVLVRASDWEQPSSRTADDFLTTHLCRQYPGQFGGMNGGRLAKTLVVDDRVTLLLDGLDDIEPPLREPILEALDSASFRWIVFVDTEHASLVAETVVDALAVELDKISIQDIDIYLGAEPGKRPPPPWSAISDAIRCRAGGLREALTWPATLSLMRGTQDSEDVDRLVEMASEPTDTVEAYVRRRALEYAYRSRPNQEFPYTAEKARDIWRTIARLAEREAPPDRNDILRIAWWRIPSWTWALPRTVLVGLLAGLSVLLGFWILLVPDNPFVDLSAVFAAGLAGIGAAIGCWRTKAGTSPSWWKPSEGVSSRSGVLGVALGYIAQFLLVALVDLPDWLYGIVAAAPALLLIAFWRVRVLPGTPRPWRQVAQHLSVRLTMGLLAGGVLGLLAILGPGYVLDVGLFLAAAAMLALGLELALAQPVSDPGVAISPDGSAKPTESSQSGAVESSWCSHRRGTMVIWLLLGIPGGILIILPVETGLTSDTLFTYGFALVVGLMLGNLFPATWTTVLATVQLSMLYRTPVRLVPFLDDARKRGIVGSDGMVYTFPKAALGTGGEHEERVPPNVLPPPRQRVASRTRLLSETVNGRLVAVVAITAAAWLGFGLLYPELRFSQFALRVTAACAAGAALGTWYRHTTGRRSGPLAEVRPRPGAFALFAAGAAYAYLIAFDLDEWFDASKLIVGLAWGLTAGMIIWIVVVFAHWALVERTRSAWARIVHLPGPAPLFGAGLGFLAATELAVADADVLIYFVELAVAVILVATGLYSAVRHPAPVVDHRGHRRAESTRLLILGGLTVGFAARSTIRTSLQLIPDSSSVIVVTVVSMLFSLIVSFSVIALIPRNRERPRSTTDR